MYLPTARSSTLWNRDGKQLRELGSGAPPGQMSNTEPFVLLTWGRAAQLSGYMAYKKRLVFPQVVKVMAHENKEYSIIYQVLWLNLASLSAEALWHNAFILCIYF